MEKENSSIDQLAGVQEKVFDHVERAHEPLNKMQDAALMQVDNMLKTSLSYYNSPRQDGEEDLVAIVRSEFEKAGVRHLDKIYDTNRHIQDAKNLRAHAQQYHLNRFFSEELNCAQYQTGIDTRISRNCLIYEIQPAQWLTIVERQVIPNLVSTGYYDGQEQTGG